MQDQVTTKLRKIQHPVLNCSNLEELQYLYPNFEAVRSKIIFDPTAIPKMIFL